MPAYEICVLKDDRYSPATTHQRIPLDDEAAISQAARLAGDLGKRFPEDTIAQLQYLPMIHAALALRSGDAGKAIEALKVAGP